MAKENNLLLEISTDRAKRQSMALADSWEAFRLFAEPASAEIYTRIELIAHDWEDGTESPIASMDFAEPYSF